MATQIIQILGNSPPPKTIATALRSDSPIAVVDRPCLASGRGGHGARFPCASAAVFGLHCAMPKRSTKQPQSQSWAVYHIKGTPAKLVGIVDNAPDEKTAIERAIEEYQVPAIGVDRGAMVATARRAIDQQAADPLRPCARMWPSVTGSPR
jgi:hypothetical protein